MKTIKILLTIILAIISLQIKARDAKDIKFNNGIFLIESDNVSFCQEFTFRMSLELYSDKESKQYAMKLSIPLKEYYAFKTNGEIIFNLRNQNNTRLQLRSSYNYGDNENSYAIIPLTESEIESIIKGIESIEFDLLQYDRSEEIVKEKVLIEKYKKSGWERYPGALRWRNYNFIKQLKKFYGDINKDYKKLKDNRFTTDKKSKN